MRFVTLHEADSGPFRQIGSAPTSNIWGVYTQGDGNGVTGGKGGEGLSVPYFMVRIRIPNGILLSHQVRAIADVAAKYARGLIDITVRQNIQLHWVRIEDLPDLLEQSMAGGSDHHGLMRR